MFAKAIRYLNEKLVGFFRSLANNSESITHRSNSNPNFNPSTNLSSNQQPSRSIESFISIRSSTSTESSYSSNSTSTESFETKDKMKRKSSKFDKLCKEFEIRIENSVKLVKDKVQVTSAETEDVVFIDDDIEVEFANLIKKKKQKTDTKKEVRLFGDITSKLQNAQQTQIQQFFKPNSALKSIASDANRIVQSKTSSKVDPKETSKNLKPENYRIQQVISQEQLVFFDLETSGMGTKQDILQIGAINHENKKFNYYAKPTSPIPAMSSRIHHITFKDNQLYYRKNPVYSQPIIEVLLKFGDYINATKSDKIVLVAHNANFDRRFLIDKICEFNLQGRLHKIVGFLDTLPLFRQLMPNEECYKQDRLILSHFPQTKTDFHNALTDVIYLKKLFENVALSRMKKEYKFLNEFTQTLEYGFLKKEQQMFEEMAKMKPAPKSCGDKAKKSTTTSSSIFIDGVPAPKEKKTRKTRSTDNQASDSQRRSKRLKK